MLNLSLLVCTKNSAKSIISCLDSALPILNSGAELILIDGRSNDNTIGLILKFIKLNNIAYYKIISQLKNGLYEAFNLAIRIAFCDISIPIPFELIISSNKLNNIQPDPVPISKIDTFFL